ncbi:hypothetical protein NBRC10512_004184 [Rhodotorula toruloides]|uniref:RHTO0S12e00320g1_1 n=2 Tax=Rhodotorula toruloides TaxID=5286 RepID=A0A061B9T4_RHOTO|nr:uncharacterized protein RHTO_07668 [Rhodotorula toruloides NP11]EMS23326.1 hypothetical protein RHTO_07668 [Rhodotorula toruloides NP11]CDR46096.1 RHTO0S12e00320g1_1 [Rhodotorula toruloides]
MSAPSTTDDSDIPPPPRRQPSKRVSALVSHFENAATSTSPASLSRPAVVQGRLGDMDWTPRPARQAVATTAKKGEQKKAADEQEKRNPLMAKAKAAKTVIVPAPVSVATEDKMTMAVENTQARTAKEPFEESAANLPDPPIADDGPADTASQRSSQFRQPLLSRDPTLAPPRRPSFLRAFSSGLSALSSFRRPSLPPSVSKTTIATFSTVRTEAVPAYRLFARDAQPLVLPDLDKVLDELGGPAEFSPMPGLEEIDDLSASTKKRREDEEWELNKVESSGSADEVFGSEEERKGWEEWLRGSGPSLFARLKRRSFRRPLPPPDPTRRLIFPPFHLLPPHLTVTDLKHNRRRPPPLLTLQGVLATVGNGVLGAASSTTGISMTTVEGVRDLMQMITLLVTAGSPTLASITASSSSANSSQKSLLRTLFVTVPSALSLDFVSAFGQALLFLLVLTLVTLFALYEFYRFTGGWAGPAARRGARDIGEGYDREGADTVGGSKRWLSWRNSYGWRVFVTFWCTSLYLPLSKLAIGALVYTDDYWPVSNPYTLYDSDAPSPPPLGPAATYYNPMDFCYRTTMRRRQGLKNLNFAYVLLPIAAVVILVLSLWLPWRLYKVIEEKKPKVDGWTELGERRKDENAEYERLLEADPSPFSFLYCDYRRSWACFRSIYLVVKLINVLLVVLIQKDNCAFRSFSATHLSVIRQGCLFAFMCLFCVLSAVSSPFLDIPSNSSDLVSRFGYVILAMLGLLAAVKIPYTDPATIAVNVVIYGFSAYFIVISKSFVQRWVKRAQRRLDFSIDIFSPHLDLSKHIARRVWQETVAALVLCSPIYAMPPKRKLVFTEDPQLPPYLLAFGGSVAERFVGDLQILRNIGLNAYSDALNDIETDARLMQLRHRIRTELAGPDVFYHPANSPLPTTSCFGRLDICAFPFVVVFRYDEQPDEPVHLNQADELERLVEQNASPTVVAARKVRLALRALEDQVVFRPHIESRQLGLMGPASVEQHTSYRFARLRIKHNSTCRWRGYNFSSGFEVSLEYRDGEGVDSRGRLRTGQRFMLSGPQFGVLDDFSLTQDVAKLFRLNRHLIDERLPDVERRMRQHREFFRHEADLKSSVLSRGFLLSIFADDRLSTDDIDQNLRTTEQNPNVQQMCPLHKTTFVCLEERMSAVTSSAVRAWWFLLFDDLWRRNPGLPAACFSPHYSSSICYNPMSRAKFEAFLRERGFSTTSRYSCFHAGFLNQIYFYLEEQIFSPTSRSIPIRLASLPDRLPFDQIHHPHARDGMHSHAVPLIDKRIEHSEVRPSRLTVTTGGGTDEDDRSIRERRALLFEEIYEQPAPSLAHGHVLGFIRFQLGVKLPEAAKVFLGLEPCMRDWRPSEDEGIVLDLRRGRGGWEAPRLRKEEGGAV